MFSPFFSRNEVVLLEDVLSGVLVLANNIQGFIIQVAALPFVFLAILSPYPLPAFVISKLCYLHALLSPCLSSSFLVVLIPCHPHALS